MKTKNQCKNLTSHFNNVLVGKKSTLRQVVATLRLFQSCEKAIIIMNGREAQGGGCGGV